MALAEWAREMAAAESAGELRERVGDREGREALYEVGAGLRVRAVLRLREDGTLAVCELIDLERPGTGSNVR